MISDEDLHILREKAAAFDEIVRSRLADGYLRRKFRIEFMKSTGKFNLTMRINCAVIMTPFGIIQMSEYENGYRDLVVQDGDSIEIDHEIKLTIN